MVCVCLGHSSVFGMFRADCFVRVSLQDLLPEEILQAALVAGKGDRRRTRRWGKHPGWASPGSVVCACPFGSTQGSVM